MVAVVLVIAGGVAFAGGGVLEDARQKPVSAALAVGVDGANVTVSHESGDALAATEVDLVVQSADGATRLPLETFTRRGDGDGTLSAGETYAVGHGLSGETAEVRVVHRPSGSVLARDRVEAPFVGRVPDPAAAIGGYSLEPSQAGSGSLTVSEGTYRLDGNTWQEVDFDYTVTPDTVLVFEFHSDDEGELHAIGLGTDNTGSQPLYKVYGTQSAANTGGYEFNGTYDTYTDGDGWVRYEVPVGEAFQGDVSHLVFVNDDDGGGSVTSAFRNVRVYEV
jgi:FlaG/FlaF family flagellin (archaellin)